jgi:hypothetical protein
MTKVASAKHRRHELRKHFSDNRSVLRNKTVFYMVRDNFSRMLKKEQSLSSRERSSRLGYRFIAQNASVIKKTNN